MSLTDRKGESRSRRAGTPRFVTTHWSMVLSARHAVAGRSPEAHQALAALCKTYWYPLYAYVRRQGFTAHDAQDLTQSFFARLFEKNFLGDVRRRRGRFRSFLLAALKHFVANERDRARAKKRGGGQPPLSLDFKDAENRYCLEPAHELTAEKLYERRWALTLLDEVLTRLRREFVTGGKSKPYNRLKHYLTGEKTRLPYAEMAAELGMTEGALKVTIHRMRRRFRALLRAQIGQTVSGPDEVDEEIRQLFAAIGS